MLGCREPFENLGNCLHHFLNCPWLRNAWYWCPFCQRPENFTTCESSSNSYLKSTPSKKSSRFKRTMSFFKDFSRMNSAKIKPSALPSDDSFQFSPCEISRSQQLALHSFDNPQFPPHEISGSQQLGLPSCDKPHFPPHKISGSHQLALSSFDRSHFPPHEISVNHHHFAHCELSESHRLTLPTCDNYHLSMHELSASDFSMHELSASNFSMNELTGSPPTRRRLSESHRPTLPLYGNSHHSIYELADRHRLSGMPSPNEGLLNVTAEVSPMSGVPDDDNSSKNYQHSSYYNAEGYKESKAMDKSLNYVSFRKPISENIEPDYQLSLHEPAQDSATVGLSASNAGHVGSNNIVGSNHSIICPSSTRSLGSLWTDRPKPGKSRSPHFKIVSEKGMIKEITVLTTVLKSRSDAYMQSRDCDYQKIDYDQSFNVHGNVVSNSLPPSLWLDTQLRTCPSLHDKSIDGTLTFQQGEPLSSVKSGNTPHSVSSHSTHVSWVDSPSENSNTTLTPDSTLSSSSVELPSPASSSTQSLTSDNTISCDGCGTPFRGEPVTRKQNLRRHIRFVHNNFSLACPNPKCLKRYTRPDNLKTHLRKVHKMPDSFWQQNYGRRAQ